MHDSIDLLDHYIESYEKRGIDFCFTSVHLQNVDTFEKVYGTGAAEMLVHQIADRLVSEVGKNSVILKGTGREFIIFSQKTDFFAEDRSDLRFAAWQADRGGDHRCSDAGQSDGPGQCDDQNDALLRNVSEELIAA